MMKKIAAYLSSKNPKVLIVVGFALCFTMQLINFLYDVYKPKSPPAPTIFSDSTYNSTLKKPKAALGPDIEESKIQTMARTAEALLKSGKPLSKADSIYIIQTDRIIKSYNKSIQQGK